MAFCLAGFTGCKKKVVDTGLAPMTVQGVQVDIPKLQASLESSTNADLKSSATEMFQSFRYGKYDATLMELDKLSNSPNLDEQQKKLVSTVIDQMKQVIAKAPPSPAPTQ